MHSTVGCICVCVCVRVCVSGRVGNNFATSRVIVYLDFCGTKYKNCLVSVISRTVREK